MEKREKVIKIRVTASEYQELVQRSNKPRLAEWMRENCLGSKVLRANKVPNVDPSLLRQLAGLGNNLNQIARVTNLSKWKSIDKIQILSALASIQRELEALKAENTHDDS